MFALARIEIRYKELCFYGPHFSLKFYITSHRSRRKTHITYFDDTTSKSFPPYRFPYKTGEERFRLPRKSLEWSSLSLFLCKNIKREKFTPENSFQNVGRFQISLKFFFSRTVGDHETELWYFIFLKVKYSVQKYFLYF